MPDFIPEAAPEEVGRYEIGTATYYALPTKPNWWRRLAVRVIFGWRWEDA